MGVQPEIFVISSMLHNAWKSNLMFDNLNSMCAQRGNKVSLALTVLHRTFPSSRHWTTAAYRVCFDFTQADRMLIPVFLIKTIVVLF